VTTRAEHYRDALTAWFKDSKNEPPERLECRVGSEVIARVDGAGELEIRRSHLTPEEVGPLTLFLVDMFNDEGQTVTSVLDEVRAFLAEYESVPNSEGDYCCIDCKADMRYVHGTIVVDHLPDCRWRRLMLLTAKR
jgi:hypothetical protein